MANTKRKNNVMKKIGKGLKKTFMEMSISLAGWIDDTSANFQPRKKNKTKKNSSHNKQKQNRIPKPISEN